MATEPLVLLSRTLDRAGVVIAGIGDDQVTLPTPCRSWDVGALLDHLMHNLRQFTIRATGGTPEWTAAAPTVAGDRLGAYRTAADGLLDAWRQAGDLSGTVQLPGMGEVPARFPVDQQIAEVAVHGWDLAKATGQTTDLDPEIGRVALDWARTALPVAYRGDEADGKMFGPEVPVPDDTPVYDRLAAFFGRHPN